MNKIASIHPNGYFLLAAESKRQWKISYLFRFVTSAQCACIECRFTYPLYGDMSQAKPYTTLLSLFPCI